MKDGCYHLLLAAAACPWPDRSAMDISSGATCVADLDSADLDSAALALTKEASGNSRGGQPLRLACPYIYIYTHS